MIIQRETINESYSKIPSLFNKYYNIVSEEELCNNTGMSRDDLVYASDVDGSEVKHIAWGLAKDKYLDIFQKYSLDVVEFVQEKGSIYPAFVDSDSVYDVSKEISKVVLRNKENESYNKIHESTYDVSNIEDMQDLSDLMSSDSIDDTIDIIDPEAECEDDISTSYIGKIILDCNVCHTKCYSDIEDIIIDDSTNCVNTEQECPYCHCMDGFTIVGKVAEYHASEDVNTEEKTIDESVQLKYDQTTNRKCLLEGTWSIPDTDDKISELESILSRPINNKDAEEKLYNIIGNDSLYDNLDDPVDPSDVRFEICSYIREFILEAQKSKDFDTDMISKLRKILIKYCK